MEAKSSANCAPRPDILSDLRCPTSHKLDIGLRFVPRRIGKLPSVCASSCGRTLLSAGIADVSHNFIFTVTSNGITNGETLSFREASTYCETTR